MMRPQPPPRHLPRLLRGLLLVTLLCAPPVQAWNGFSLSGFDFERVRQLHINTPDGTRLAAHVIVPRRSGDQALPAVIFIDDWASEPYDYIVQAARFAAEGYIVVRYQPRGFGHSSGTLDLAGHRDLQDFGAVLDWLILNTPADEARIGAIGVSVGGAIGLIAAAQDPLVRVVAALSAWSNLHQSIHRNGVGNLAWSRTLADSGVARRIDPVLSGHVDELTRGGTRKSLVRWAEDRSPETWLEIFNRRGVPVYLANNYQDELVDLNGVVRFFERLEGPKRLVLSQGSHAGAEAQGMLGFNDFLWPDVLAWMNGWLRDAGPAAGTALVSMELDQTAVRDEFILWPSDIVETATFHLGPRVASGNGSIDRTPWEGDKAVSNSINGGEDSLASASSVVSRGVDGAGGELTPALWLPALDRSRALVFESRPLAKPLPVRGAATLDLWLTSSTANPRLVAYLYEVNELGLGRLVTHGAVAREVPPNQPFPLRLEMQAAARDLQPGNHLALVIDSDDPQYMLPGNGGFALRFLFSPDHRPLLQVPYNRTLLGDRVRYAQAPLLEE